MLTFPLGEIPVFEAVQPWAVKVDPRLVPERRWKEYPLQGERGERAGSAHLLPGSFDPLVYALLASLRPAESPRSQLSTNTFSSKLRTPA